MGLQIVQVTRDLQIQASDVQVKHEEHRSHKAMAEELAGQVRTLKTELAMESQNRQEQLHALSEQHARSVVESRDLVLNQERSQHVTGFTQVFDAHWQRHVEITAGQGTVLEETNHQLLKITDEQTERLNHLQHALEQERSERVRMEEARVQGEARMEGMTMQRLVEMIEREKFERQQEQEASAQRVQERVASDARELHTAIELLDNLTHQRVLAEVGNLRAVMEHESPQRTQQVAAVHSRVDDDGHTRNLSSETQLQAVHDETQALHEKAEVLRTSHASLLGDVRALEALYARTLQGQLEDFRQAFRRDLEQEAQLRESSMKGIREAVDEQRAAITQEVEDRENEDQNLQADLGEQREKTAAFKGEVDDIARRLWDAIEMHTHEIRVDDLVDAGGEGAWVPKRTIHPLLPRPVVPNSAAPLRGGGSPSNTAATWCYLRSRDEFGFAA
eukprot:NODE_715_length_1395_cov_243.693284.p1 GENE.NODE_715_length_1395_cov_243.693284~~NODE_715_length_1395_cov_243.693284.p1  ORF type:complete len:448 (+),score=208.98 NODE_715_length_1395_cov_243.693284:3-1346(+)